MSTRWSVSDRSSDKSDGPDARLAPSSGLPSSAAAAQKRGKLVSMDSGHNHPGLSDFLLERFQQDAMNAAEEYREHHQQHQREREQQQVSLHGGDKNRSTTSMDGLGGEIVGVHANNKQLGPFLGSGEARRGYSNVLCVHIGALYGYFAQSFGLMA